MASVTPMSAPPGITSSCGTPALETSLQKPPPCDTPALETRLQTLLDKSAELCDKCEALNHIPGVSKLRKQCQAERQFLHRVRDKNKLAKSHLNSTNLSHLQAVLQAAESLPHVVQVLQPFHCNHGNHTLVVDVVCNHGYAWVKVIARKAQALHLVWAGQGQFGERSIFEQVTLYQTCAETYPMSFEAPQLVFLFANSVTSPMAAALERKRVTVLGKRVPVQPSILRRLGARDANDDESDSESDSDEVDEDFVCDTVIGEDMDAKLSDRFISGVQVSSDGKSSADNNEGIDDFEDCDKPIPRASEIFPSGEIKLTGNTSSSETDVCSDYPEETCDDATGKIEKADDKEEEESTGIFPPPFTIDQESLTTLFSSVPRISKVNLDITSLICLASNVCHGHCNYDFKDHILSGQAARERLAPVLPKLSAFLKDKELYACQTAVSEFRTIVGTVGGPQERERAAGLLATVTVVPDQLSDRAQRLKLTHQIKHRGKIIFGTGDDLQAITVTANTGFVRASMKQGMNFAVYIHEPRALTEQKEATATPL